MSGLMLGIQDVHTRADSTLLTRVSTWQFTLRPADSESATHDPSPSNTFRTAVDTGAA